MQIPENRLNTRRTSNPEVFILKIPGASNSEIFEREFKRALCYVYADAPRLGDQKDVRTAFRYISCWGSTCKLNYTILQKWVVEQFPGESEEDDIANKRYTVWENLPRPWGLSLLFAEYIRLCCISENYSMSMAYEQGEIDKVQLEKRRAIKNAGQNFKNCTLEELENLSITDITKDLLLPNIPTTKPLQDWHWKDFETAIGFLEKLSGDVGKLLFDNLSSKQNQVAEGLCDFFKKYLSIEFLKKRLSMDEKFKGLALAIDYIYSLAEIEEYKKSLVEHITFRYENCKELI